MPPPATALAQLTSCIADRVQKLKEARTQATKEIEEYRKFKEDEFKAFEASVRRAPLAHIAILDASHSTPATRRTHRSPSTKRRK